MDTDLSFDGFSVNENFNVNLGGTYQLTSVNKETGLLTYVRDFGKPPFHKYSTGKQRLFSIKRVRERCPRTVKLILVEGNFFSLFLLLSFF